MEKVILTGKDLTLEEVERVSRAGAEVCVSPEAVAQIERSRAVIDDFVKRGMIVYGVTTGFGKFSDVVISKEDCVRLQRNLIMSHAVGVGENFTTDIVRGVMLLRLNSLAQGYSGIRLETFTTLLAMLNKGVHPLLPQKGSLGSSGDLAPLAHMVLPMLGMGRAEYEGRVLSGQEAMKEAGIPLINLHAKEGIALINGTQVMSSVGSLVVRESLNLLKVADIAAALTFEACNGVVDALDPKVHAIRAHKGQRDSARVLLQLLAGSEMTSRQGELRVQDPYTLRCLPQIHGASKNAIVFVQEQLEVEINSVTDNPLIFPETLEVISGGNFHGQPVALSFDFLAIALAELANVAERRIERLVNPALNYGLPAFLVKEGGLNSGYMIVQYSAAALVSENKILAHPASVDSIPSSANQEDHVSMGTIAARKAADILENTRKVLAMELMCACQAIDLRGRKKLGKGTHAAYEVVRNMVPYYAEDREISPDINLCEELIINGSLVSTVENACGALV